LSIVGLGYRRRVFVITYQWCAWRRFFKAQRLHEETLMTARDMLSVFASPRLAIGFGSFLFAVETCRHFDSLAQLPASWVELPFHDWAAGLFLVLAGHRARRDWNSGRAAQAAAWAFSLSLLIAAFFAHVEFLTSDAPDDEWIPKRILIAIVGPLAVVALLGLAATLSPRQAAVRT